MYDRIPFNELSDWLAVAINAPYQACVQRTGLSGESSGWLAPVRAKCAQALLNVPTRPTPASERIVGAALLRQITLGRSEPIRCSFFGTWSPCRDPDRARPGRLSPLWITIMRLFGPTRQLPRVIGGFQYCDTVWSARSD